MKNIDILIGIGIVSMVLIGLWWYNLSSISDTPANDLTQSSTTTVTQDNELGRVQSRADFEAFLNAYLPETMCRPDRYFRRCFLVTDAICLNTARTALRECFDVQAKKMGSRVRAEDVKTWQNLTGRCAGLVYDRKLADHRKEIESCSL